MSGMPQEWTPTDEDTDAFAQYKAHIEGERALKPDMEKRADRALANGATVGQLARLTGLTPEVFRRRARALGVERKRPPTVGKLSPAAPEPIAPAPSEEPNRRPAIKQRQRTQPVVKEGRPLTDEEAKTLAELAYSRAGDLQAQRLKQDAAQVGEAYKDFTVVSSAMSMGLLTHDEVYAQPAERPAGSEETSG